MPRTSTSTSTSNVKLTNAHLRQIAGMVVSVLQSDLAAAAAKQAAAADAAAVLKAAEVKTAAEQQAKLAAAARDAQLAAVKAAEQPQPSSRKRKAAPTPAATTTALPTSSTVTVTLAYATLTARLAEQLLAAAAKVAGVDVSQVRWMWTHDASDRNSHTLTFTGQYGHRAARWATVWLASQPEVMSYRDMGQAVIRVHLRPLADIPFGE